MYEIKCIIILLLLYFYFVKLHQLFLIILYLICWYDQVSLLLKVTLNSLTSANKFLFIYNVITNTSRIYVIIIYSININAIIIYFINIYNHIFYKHICFNRYKYKFNYIKQNKLGNYR